MTLSKRNTLLAVGSCLFIGLVSAAFHFAITVQMATSGLQPVDPSVPADEVVLVSVSFLERLIAPLTYWSPWEFWWRDFPFFSVLAFLGMVVGYLLAKPGKEGS